MRALVLDHPVATGLALLAAATLFRLIDIFVLRLDERWGEIIVSKIAGAALLIAFLAATGAGLAAAGFHMRALAPSLLLGVGLTLVALAAGYSVEFFVQTQRGEHPSFALAAIDPKTGLGGAAWFALFLLFGNVVNSFAEEGLFRGVLIPLFLRRSDVWAALFASALLFGLWHLPWAVKALLKGDQTPLAQILVANFLAQALMGIVWGFLYLRTGNLWGAWAAHTLGNSAINFVHVRSIAGMDAGLFVRMAVFTALMLLGMIVIEKMAQAYGLSPVAPWGAAPN